VTEIPLILSSLAAAPAERAALATLVSVRGSSYRRPGARLLLLEGGARAGAISGGCLEDDIVLHARRVLESGDPEVVTYDTTQDNDLVWGTGTGCHGIIRVLVEPIAPARPAWVAELSGNLGRRVDTELAVVVGGAPAARPGTALARDLPPLPGGAEVFRDVVPAPLELIVFGAGDDAQPLVRMAKELGWHVTLIDSRPAYASRERFPLADRIWVASAEQIASHLELDRRAFVVVMTHRFQEDVRLLQVLLPRPLAYLGILGARRRTERLFAILSDGDPAPTSEQRERVHAPIGLDLGATTPESIALSILAEIQGHLTAPAPVPPRERRAPIRRH
jgi:xanthine/CO dehydrogenase XdhC/CoxF family maturation factor